MLAPLTFTTEDALGRAIPGAYVDLQTYAGGVVTAIWLDDAGTVAAPSPLVTDSLGKLTVWVPAGAYRWRARTAQYTLAWEPVDAVWDAGTAKGVAIYSGTSYPPRPQFPSVEWIGPVDPGALAADNDTWITRP